MAKETAAQFDQLGALYEDMANWPFRRRIETPSVKTALGDLRSLDALDYGCGSGFYSRVLKNGGARRVVGYDLADGMLAYAKRRAQAERVDVEFTSSLTPDHAESFDLVLSVYVLPYATTATELTQMCAEMMRPLRPGGRLIALPIHPRFEPVPSYYEGCGFRLTPDDGDTPYRDGSRIRLDLCYQQHDASVYAWYWSAESIDAALRAAGAATVTWSNPDIDRRGDPAQVPPELQAYVDKPHAAVIECRKE